MLSFKFNSGPPNGDIIYTYLKGNKLPDLRKRIIRVAASYIGQKEINGNLGYKDSEFEKKMKNVGWQADFDWCNLFCRLVYAEAFYGGNAIPSLSGPSAYNDANNFTKSSSGRYRTSLKGQNTGGDYTNPNLKRGLNDYAVGNTAWNATYRAKAGNRFINLSGGNPGTGPQLSVYTNFGKKLDLLKKFISVGAVYPGDLMIFDWKNDLKGGKNSNFPGAQHIGIYLGGASSTDVIDGNANGGIVSRNTVSIASIRGIVQLSTVEQP
jgi:hypothetical protein